MTSLDLFEFPELCISKMIQFCVQNETLESQNGQCKEELFSLKLQLQEKENEVSVERSIQSQRNSELLREKEDLQAQVNTFFTSMYFFSEQFIQYFI